MNLGLTTINRWTVGALGAAGIFLGYNSLTEAPDRINTTLYDAVGDWATWADAPAYTPNLAGQVFNVLDYGADPTNTVNSTPGIRAAFAAARTWQLTNSNGLVTVYIPEGTYAVWRDTQGSEDFIVTLHQDNLVVEGDGPGLSIINARATGGAVPSDLIVNRGILFCTRGTPTPLDGITFRGLRMTGNAPVNQYAGQFSSEIDPATGMPYHARGWDVNHKAIGIWESVTGLVVEDCEFDGWRGEEIYGGSGHESGTVLVRRCIVRECNASAISIGGDVTVEDSDIYEAFNGLECFMLGGAQALTVDNCTVEPVRVGNLPEGNGIAFLGYSVSSLTVTNSHFGESIAGVFISSMASNVLVDGNTFTDCKPIYALFDSSYVDNPSVDQDELNRLEHVEITNNTVTALTEDVEAFMLTYVNTGVDWTITGNTTVSTGENIVTDFLACPSGATGGFDVSGNTLNDSRPLPLYTGPRPVWASDNVVNGYYSLGTEFNSTTAGPIVINPAWARVRISDLGGGYSIPYGIDPAELANFPDGFILEIRRAGSGDNLYGVEIKPDTAWNSLSRGYMLYAGAVLTMTKTSGKFALTSWTPPTENIWSISDTYPTYPAGQAMNFYGQAAVNLTPAVPHLYSGFVGVAIGDTVSIHYNTNTRIEHIPGLVEISTAANFVASGSGTLSATRDAAGVLQITIP